MDGSRKAVLVALSANIGIATAKLAGFLVTGSAALLAETFHSVADTSDQTLLLLGRWRARRRQTPEHPFGYGRERYFWAFMVAILLFTLGAAGAVREGITQLVRGEELVEPGWGLAILAVALLLDSVSLRTATRQAQRGDDPSWWRYVRDTKQPEIPVILLEDAGAVVGVLVAMAGLGLTVLTGDQRYDAAASIGVGAVLGVMALILAREMKSLLIGEAAAPEQAEAIREIVRSDADVRDLVYLRTMHLGPETILIEAKVRFGEELGSRDVALAIDRMERRIRTCVDAARVISIEADVPRSGDPDLPEWEEHETSGDAPGR